MGTSEPSESEFYRITPKGRGPWLRKGTMAGSPAVSKVCCRSRNSAARGGRGCGGAALKTRSTPAAFHVEMRVRVHPAGLDPSPRVQPLSGLGYINA